MLKKILFLFLILNSRFLIGQIQFQRTIGGTGNEYAYSIIQTTDGGYAVAGHTNSFGAGFGDLYLVKLNGSGTLQWSKTIGGAYDDERGSVIQTTDGGFAMAGFSGSFGYLYDFYLVKLDFSGTLQWNRIVVDSILEYAYSIIQTTDRGFALTGVAESNPVGQYKMYIVKFDSSGSRQWVRTIYGAVHYERAYSIIQTTDGGLVIAGNTVSFGVGGDMYILKFNISGSLQWSKTIGGTNSDGAYSITKTTDGGIVAAGYTYSFGAGGTDIYIVKLDATGSLQWTRAIGGITDDLTRSIIQTTDGGYALAGYTNSFGAGGYDFYIVKLDVSGNLQWSRTVGGAGDDFAYSIIQTTDGGCAVAGYTNSFGAGNNDVYIVKLDANGNTCGNFSSPTSTVTSPTSTVTSATPTITTPNPTITSPTPTVSTGGTVTTICLVGIQPISNETPGSYQLEQNYPNPFNNNSKIKMQISKLGDVKLVIYDALGKEVESLVNEKLNPGTYEVEWNASNFTSGIYFYSMQAGDYKQTKRMVLLK